MEEIYQAAFVLLSSVGGASALFWFATKWFGKFWASKILESDRAKYAKELDEIRHKFEIEFNQLSIIHENQKNSFQRVIKALQKSIKSLKQEYDEEWFPINSNPFDTLKEIVIEESLFLGSEGEKALDIYLNFFSRSIATREEPRPNDRVLRNIYEYIVFISERIREYFRKRIGLSDEPDPLLDVNLLAACLLINEYHFNEIDFPTKSALKFNFDTSPQALVDRVNDNIKTLKSELIKLITYLENTPEKKKHFFLTLSKARYYLKIIENI